MYRFNYRRAALLGLATLGINVLWGIYNSQLPILLQAGRPDFAVDVPGYAFSPTMAGFIMTLDNVLALFIHPYIGARSDHTRTRLGRRLPYILVGAPLACLAFVAIPHLAGGPLPLFIGAILLTLLALDLFHAPLTALMPDLTPSAQRSQVNGVINLMGRVRRSAGLSCRRAALR
ncbi:SLC45 family MFS transporter [Candidatus Gracilibacteria bacterium]|nr:SLC45 family MFS transporter [Candidatus Gracilibacteria bacterium]